MARSIAIAIPRSLSSPWIEHAPSPMVTVEGAAHTVREVNASFCRLFDKLRDDIVGSRLCDLLPDNPECMALLNRVYRRGQAASLTGKAHTGPAPIFSSFQMWPVIADYRTVGVVIQVTKTMPYHEQTLEMNEALLLGALRQHELTAAAGRANLQLQAEVAQRMQSERDAVMLTKEISHRIKNNLQIVVALIANEIKRTPTEFARGYVATEARIAAIAELYALISSSGDTHGVSLDAYLRQIAKTMAASLLEASSAITIEVSAEDLELDSDRAVAFGLAVNELCTNAVKHAFPGGSGLIRLTVARVGEMIELIVADDGIGMAQRAASSRPGKHGSDYLAIFVRQLGGAMDVSAVAGAGTTVTIKFPDVLAGPVSD